MNEPDSDDKIRAAFAADIEIASLWPSVEKKLQSFRTFPDSLAPLLAAAATLLLLYTLTPPQAARTSGPEPVTPLDARRLMANSPAAGTEPPRLSGR